MTASEVVTDYDAPHREPTQQLPEEFGSRHSTELVRKVNSDHQFHAERSESLAFLSGRCQVPAKLLATERLLRMTIKGDDRSPRVGTAGDLRDQLTVAPVYAVEHAYGQTDRISDHRPLRPLKLFPSQIDHDTLPRQHRSIADAAIATRYDR